MSDWASVGSRAAIAGVAMTRISAESGRSELELAREAVVGALDDAGLQLGDIDGLVTYTLDPHDPLQLAQALGLSDLRWFSTVPFGGGAACATVQDAVLAVSTGLAEVVVAYRAANMRSGTRFGRFGPTVAEPMRWVLPFGVATPAHCVAPWFHRYLHEFGLTNADLAPVAVSAREFASTNPQAHFFGRPLTENEHQSAPWVAEPVLRVPDCCLESDGGAALVVTSRPRAADGPTRPVRVTAAARGMARQSSAGQNYYGNCAELPDAKVVAAELWKQCGLTTQDITAAMLYDGFTPVVLMTLEAFGFCGPGDAAAFVAEGHIGRHGRLPVNPSGGQLGEGYLHGFNGMVEAVRQIRGTAVNQVADVEHVLVTGGLYAPGSAMVLSPWR